MPVAHRGLSRGVVVRQVAGTPVKRTIRAIAGLIVLALLICVWAIIIDEKCSRHLDYNDILWEEINEVKR